MVWRGLEILGGDKPLSRWTERNVSMGLWTLRALESRQEVEYKLMKGLAWDRDTWVVEWDSG